MVDDYDMFKGYSTKFPFNIKCYGDLCLKHYNKNSNSEFSAMLYGRVEVTMLK